jgi:hypothetical protein
VENNEPRAHELWERIERRPGADVPAGLLVPAACYMYRALLMQTIAAATLVDSEAAFATCIARIRVLVAAYGQRHGAAACTAMWHQVQVLRAARPEWMGRVMAADALAGGPLAAARIATGAEHLSALLAVRERELERACVLTIVQRRLGVPSFSYYRQQTSRTWCVGPCRHAGGLRG